MPSMVRRASKAGAGLYAFGFGQDLFFWGLGLTASLQGLGFGPGLRIELWNFGFIPGSVETIGSFSQDRGDPSIDPPRLQFLLRGTPKCDP